MVKKSKFFLCLVLLFSIILSTTKLVNAAENSEINGTVTIKEITQQEFDEYDLSDWICTDSVTEVSEPEIKTRAAYTTEYYNKTYNVYTNSGDVDPAVIIKCTYTVYNYSGEKIHIYSRSMSLYTTSDYSSSKYTYGAIENTDGSFSMVKDTVQLIKNSKITNTLYVLFIIYPTSHAAYITE